MISKTRWHDVKWAATWQNQPSECAPSEDSAQPGHPPNMIRVFAVRMKKPWVLSYYLSAQRRLWLDWTDAQAIRLGGCPGWSESSLGAHSLCWFCQDCQLNSYSYISTVWNKNHYSRCHTILDEETNESLLHVARKPVFGGLRPGHISLILQVLYGRFNTTRFAIGCVTF